MEVSKDYQFSPEPVIFNEDELDRLLVHAQVIGASDISIMTGEPIIAEVHGGYHRIMKRPMSSGDIEFIVNRLYGANGTTQINLGQDIDKSYAIKIDRSRSYRYRVNITGCRAGVHSGAEITIRTIDGRPKTLDEIGVEDLIRENYRQDNGLIAICGPTGSGKSTLLSALIRHILEDETQHRKILTFEAPIEFVYDEVVKQHSFVRQHEVGVHIPSFERAIRNSLRRAPKIILVGESRDNATIQASLEASETGHSLYTTVHSNSVAETVYRMVNFFPPSERPTKQSEIVEALRMVVVQKLVRRVGGGRVALREILVFTQETRDRLRHAETLREAVSVISKMVDEEGISMTKSAYNAHAKGLIDDRTLDQVSSVSRRREASNVKVLFDD